MWNANDYTLSIQLFLRLMGLVYFFAFAPFLLQIRGLLGKEGILPAQHILKWMRFRTGRHWFYYMPTIFWLNASDRFLMAAVAAGTGISILLMCNVYPPVMLFLLYVLFLSLKTVGQDFLSFGWDVFILEITVNAFFLSLTPVPNIFVWLSLNFLLFRFYLQGGAVKLQSRDATWWDCTALQYHYQTQPLPNTIAWYVHKFPLWFHKASTVAMFVIELVVPFAIFGTQEMRLFAFVCFTFLQWAIWVTGNFSYLNYMSVVLSVILLSNNYLSTWFGEPVVGVSTSLLLDLFVSLGGIALLTLQIINLWNHFLPNRHLGNIMERVYPFHLANRYGIFAVMTTKRYEIVIEGSSDGKEWKEYQFWFKPSELKRRPRRISPFQPRLDWQVWFLPFSNFESEAWFQNFIYRLFQGSPVVLSLLRVNPFPKAPPEYIRVLLYDYEFTDRCVKRATGEWWTRHLIGYYSPTLQKVREEARH